MNFTCSIIIEFLNEGMNEDVTWRRELHLLHHQLRNCSLSLVVLKLLHARQVVVELRGVDHRDTGVESSHFAEVDDNTFVLAVVVVFKNVEEGRNLRRLRDARGLQQHVVEGVLAGQLDDLVGEVAGEGEDSDKSEKFKENLERVQQKQPFCIAITFSLWANSD